MKFTTLKKSFTADVHRAGRAVRRGPGPGGLRGDLSYFIAKFGLLFTSVIGATRAKKNQKIGHKRVEEEVKYCRQQPVCSAHSAAQ